MRTAREEATQEPRGDMMAQDPGQNCYPPGFLDSLINRINKRRDKKFRQGFIGTHSAAGGSENK